MKTVPKKINSDSLDKHENDNNVTDESQDKQSDGEANLNKTKDLNID